LNIKGEIAGGKNIIKYQQRIIRMTRELSSTQLGRQRFANGFQMASKSQGIQPCTAISLASSLAFFVSTIRGALSVQALASASETQFGKPMTILEQN